jgi:Family of unknown function (DUF6077)
MESSSAPSSLDSPPVRLVLAPVWWWITWLAVMTPVTHLFQIAGLRFRTYAVLAAIAIPVAAGIVHWQQRHAPEGERGGAAAALGLCLAGSVLALVLHRPNRDDYYYVPAAIYHLEHPDDAMDFRLTYLYGEGEPLRAISGATSQSFEYVQAALAFLTRLPFLAVYHVVTPAIMGFCIVAAFLAALATFSGNVRHALAGTATMLAFAPVLAEKVHTFTNMSFARAFQGKILLLSVGVPLIVAASRAFLRGPSPRRWVALLAIATALVGASSSAVIVVPALCVLMLVGWLAAHPWSPPPVRTVLLYGAAFGYLLGFAAVAAVTFAPGMGADSIFNLGWPTRFGGHAILLIGRPPVTPVCFAVFSAAAVVLAERAVRRFLLAWIAGAALLLNPWAGPWLIRHFTTPNVYWRLFYALPFPLVLGLAVSFALDRYGDRVSWRRGIIAAAVGAPLLLSPLLPGASVLRAENETWIGWPGPKVIPATLSDARAVAAAAPSGPMLAPPDLSGVLGLLTSAYPQMLVGPRTGEVQVLFRVAPREGMAAAEMRIGASMFSEGSGGSLEAFAGVLARYPALVSVVLRGPVVGDEHAREALRSAGFREVSLAPQLALWLREGRRSPL